jgi:hypothetical protein
MDTCQLSIGCDVAPLNGQTTSFWSEGKTYKFASKKSRDTHVIKIEMADNFNDELYLTQQK